MELFSNKISRDDLEAGDHIYSWRTAYVYSHHGIYVGGGEVIHFTCRNEIGTFLDKMKVSSFSKNLPCRNCRDRPKIDGVNSCCLDCFLHGGNLYRYKYNVSKTTFLANPRGGTCTLAPSDPAEEVLHRAKYLLSCNGFGDYHVTDNNCENFAIYCKTGLWLCKKKKTGMSGQVNSVKPSCVALALGICGLQLAGFATYSYFRLTRDIGMLRTKDAIKVPVERLVDQVTVTQMSDKEE